MAVQALRVTLGSRLLQTAPSLVVGLAIIVIYQILALRHFYPGAEQSGEPRRHPADPQTRLTNWGRTPCAPAEQTATMRFS